MTRFSIGIDGYNLALPKGTGVASYAYTLATVLGEGGHHVEGVFGLDVPPRTEPREALFFDRLGRTPETTRKGRRRAARRLFWSALPPVVTARAEEVPQTARVERAGFADRLPRFDRLLNSPRLFDLAHRHFRTHGRFVRLRVPDPPEIMHWTYPVPVELVGAHNVYTLHDIVPLRLPFTTLDAKASYRALLARCIATGHVCTVSEASRAEIVAEFGITAEHVTNTWQAAPPPADALATPAGEDAAAIQGIFGLAPHSYFLFFGAIEPKKNVGRLIEAYLSLGTPAPLVIVGGSGWSNEGELRLLGEAETAARELGGSLDGRIIRLDHQPKPLLRRLVRSARAVAFPSIAEGFGLPVLEAMQLGTPVLTSSISALPEIAGDAALLVDPYDVRAIAAGLRRLDEEPALRARLAAAGPERARFFAADRYRERLQRMYEAVLARAG